MCAQVHLTLGSRNTDTVKRMSLREKLEVWGP